MLPAFTNLAERVDRTWSECGYDHEKFSSVATESLEQAELPDFPALARALSAGLALPHQRRLDQSFGQPAITLYHDSRFVIEALCWHTGSPAIHQHSFSGAFRITTGRSVHSRFQFTEEERVCGPIAAGTLELLGVDVLDHHSVTSIQSGTGLIHSAFHLDNPSMTVIVRTHDYDEPEYTYLPPGIAFDPSLRSETLHKQLQLLDTMHSAAHPAYAECVTLAVGSSDIYDGMEVLIRAQNHSLQESLRQEFMALYRKRHGSQAEPIIRAVDEQRRRMQLISLRRSVTDGDGRYFLACLLNAFDLPSFRKLVTAHSTDGHAARTVVANGLRAMFGIGPVAEPLLELAAKAMLEAVPAAEFPAWAVPRSGRLEAGDAEILEQIYRKLEAHPLFRPVLRA
jgi:hypothetical protein